MNYLQIDDSVLHMNFGEKTVLNFSEYAMRLITISCRCREAINE